MAEALQQAYALPVVRVSLAEESSEPAIRIDLVLNREQQWQEIADSQHHRLERFGFARSDAGQDPELSVPTDVATWIADWGGNQLEYGNALWLYLVKPYGALGAVPWERDIQPLLGKPLLRLPDWLPEPERSTSTFDVALCATAPSEEGLSTATTMGPDVIGAIKAGVGPRLRLHVFADRESHGFLENAIRAMGVTACQVYEPHDDVVQSSTFSFAGENAWLDWIRREMTGRTLDAVHFITHGYTLGRDGAILTTQSPTSSDRRSTSFVQIGDLRTFLTQVGALHAVFSRPDDNWSDYALRRVVDELGSKRAGPVMLHDRRFGNGMFDLTDGYAFLSSVEKVPPPAAASVMLYAQPRQVSETSYGDDRLQLGVGELASSEAVKRQFARDDTPGWLSSAQRYIEDSEAEIYRFRESSKEQPPTKSQVAYFDGVESALRKLRSVIDRHAQVEP